MAKSGRRYSAKLKFQVVLEALVSEPTSQATSPPTKSSGEVQVELPAPESDRFVRNGDPSLREKIFDVSEAPNLTPSPRQGKSAGSNNLLAAPI